MGQKEGYLKGFFREAVMPIKGAQGRDVSMKAKVVGPDNGGPMPLRSSRKRGMRAKEPPVSYSPDSQISNYSRSTTVKGGGGAP